jgi:hypothetical protein
MKKITLTAFALLSVVLGFSQAPVCGGSYVDGGGENADYDNNVNNIVTICPEAPGEVLTVTFTSFSTEPMADGLYVYNGLSTSAPLIPSNNPAGWTAGLLTPGAYWGDTVPGPFTATNADGCLTFKFISNESVTYPGWNAAISCAPISECLSPSEGEIVSKTDTTMGVTFTPAGSGTQWMIIAVPSGSEVPGNDSPGAMLTSAVPTADDPFIISGLDTNSCYEVYVRTICDFIYGSDYVLIGTACTNPLGPTCGQMFTDAGGEEGNYPPDSDSTYVICPENPGEAVTITFSEFSTQENVDGLYVFDGPNIYAPPISSGTSAGTDPTAYAGGYWGNTIPGPFTAANPSGCLTFRFISHDSTDFAGWKAQVNCEALSLISLYAFVDTNGNGVPDPGEPPYTYGSFTLETNNSGVISNMMSSFGSADLYYEDASYTYNIGFAVDPAFSAYFSNSTFLENQTIAYGSGTQTLYFPISVLQPYNDLGVSVHASAVVPGTICSAYIVITNYGVNTVSGTVNFTKPSQLALINISVAGAVTNDNGFSYAFNNLSPNLSDVIYLYFMAPVIPEINLGDNLVYTASISGGAADVDTSNNVSTWTQTVVGSYDPNDISESHGPEIPINTFSDSDYLYYTIEFQNTGTANASKVRVENTLNEKLDAQTLQVIYSNHDYEMQRTGSQLTWNFNNINLPFEAANEAASHGYITYRIKPNPGYAVGDIIPNSAEIYFDYNPAIVTGTFNTEFTEALAMPGFNTGNLLLYPNPAKNSFSVSLAQGTGQIQSIELYDVIGEKVKTAASNNSSDVNVDVSNLSAGVYFVQINTVNGQKVIRKLIIQ